MVVLSAVQMAVLTAVRWVESLAGGSAVLWVALKVALSVDSRVVARAVLTVD